MSTLAEITGGCPQKMGCHWLIQAIHSAMLRGEVSDSRTRHGDCSFHSQKYRCLMVIQWIIHLNRMGYTIRLLERLEAICVNLIETPREWRLPERNTILLFASTLQTNQCFQSHRVCTERVRTHEPLTKLVRRTHRPNKKVTCVPLWWLVGGGFTRIEKCVSTPNLSVFFWKQRIAWNRKTLCMLRPSKCHQNSSYMRCLRTRTPHLNLSNNQQCIGSCWLQTFYLIWRTRW